MAHVVVVRSDLAEAIRTWMSIPALVGWNWSSKAGRPFPLHRHETPVRFLFRMPWCPLQSVVSSRPDRGWALDEATTESVVSSSFERSVIKYSYG